MKRTTFGALFVPISMLLSGGISFAQRQPNAQGTAPGPFQCYSSVDAEDGREISGGSRSRRRVRFSCRMMPLSQL